MIRNRLDRLEEIFDEGDGTMEFIVRRMDNGRYVSPCEFRRKGCPDFPCPPEKCWYENEMDFDMAFHIGPPDGKGK